MRKIISAMLTITLLVISTISFAEETSSYDDLQTLFLSLTPETKITDVENYITEHNLFSASHDTHMRRTRTYIVALEEGVAQISRRDSGDYISIVFDRAKDQHIISAEYFNQASWNIDGFNHKDPIGQEYRIETYFDLDKFYNANSIIKRHEVGKYYTEKNIPMNPKRKENEEFEEKTGIYDDPFSAMEKVITLLEKTE